MNTKQVNKIYLLSALNSGEIMKKTVFSILIGLVLFGFMGCKTNSNNLVTYNTTCITSNEMNEKIHFVYQPKTDKYQFARYYTPSFKWYDSAEKDETNKVNTLQFWGNINFKKMENIKEEDNEDASEITLSKKNSGLSEKEKLELELKKMREISNETGIVLNGGTLDIKNGIIDEVDKVEVKSSASKDYDTLDTAKLTVGSRSYQRLFIKSSPSFVYLKNIV